MDHFGSLLDHFGSLWITLDHFCPAPQHEPEMDTSQFLEELESDLQRPNPPPDAKLNEQGQLVWIDDSGTVYAQNPDGSILTFDVSTGTWIPLE